MTKARDIADFKFEDIVDTGTEGTKVASGTTAQRGSTTGQWRYNTTTGFFEGRNTDGTFSSLEPQPTVISTDVTEIDTTTGGNITIRVTGTNLSSGGTIKFIANDGTQITASTSTFINASNYDAVVARSSFSNSLEPYDVRFVSATGLTATLEDNINVDNAPTWNTTSGTVATISDQATGTHATLSATDPDGDTVSYSETTSVLSGAGFSLNSSTGAITGTAGAVSGDTTDTFTLRATANSKTADRQFNIIRTNLIDDINSLPENIWNSIPTGDFDSPTTYTDYYGGRFEVLSGNIVKFKQAYSTEHVLYQRANSRSNANEECYVQMYDIADAFGDASNGNAQMLFGIYYEDPTGIGFNNNTPFGYVATSNTNFRYVTWSSSQNNTEHGFYHGASNAQSNTDIGQIGSNRDGGVSSFDLNSYQLASTPTGASTNTAITFVIKPDNHSSNARKVYVYYGNTKVHTFTNLIGTSKEIHWWVGITGASSPSNGDFWTNNPPRVRYADNNGSSVYNVGG